VIVDIRCKHLFVGGVIAGDEKGIESEGCWFVREEWESGFFVVVNFWFSVIVDWFFDYFDSGGSVG